MKDNKQVYKIVVADDHNLFRKGLIKLISLSDTEQRYSILFEADNGEALKSKLDKKNLPDIILLDIDMPDTDGFETAAWLQKYYPQVRVLVISMFDDERSILRMIRMGVRGYLSKDIEVDDIHTALDAIMTTGFYYSGHVSRVMAENLFSDSQSVKEADILSEREREFLKLACSELTYQEIAVKMNVSAKTIDGYRDALFRKLDIKSRVGLVLYAIKKGIYKV